MSGDQVRRISPVPWTLRDVLFAIVLLVLGVLALNVELLLIAAVQSFASGRDIAQLASRRPLWVDAILLVGGELLIFLPAWLFSVHKYGGDWRLVGYRAFRASRGVPLAVLVVLGGLGVNIIYVQIVTMMGLDQLLPKSNLPQLGTGSLSVLVLVLAACVAAPLAEETFFRGFLFPALARRLGLVWGALISAGMFASAHLQIGAFIPILVLGLALAWLYYRTGSLWPCIIAHGTFNGLAVLASLVGPQT